jgi:hypothetical protein
MDAERFENSRIDRINRLRRAGLPKVVQALGQLH